MTLFPDLIAGLWTLGFKWQLQTYPSTAPIARTALLDIQKSIDKGNPVLIDTSLYHAHTFVVVGYETALQHLIILDPNIPDPGIRVISYKDIEEIWNSRGAGFNVRSAVFTAPKP